MRFHDITGKTFDRLLIIERVENDSRGRSRWSCVCKCGTRLVVLGSNLKRGNTRSCGCLQKEAAAALLRSLHSTRDRSGETDQMDRLNEEVAAATREAIEAHERGDRKANRLAVAKMKAAIQRRAIYRARAARVAKASVSAQHGAA